MNIYTKTGDAGSTSLVGGKRVSKNHPRVEAYGHVDELNACIGVVRAYLPDSFSPNLLPEIQKALMTLSAHIANDGSYQSLPPITQESIALLETSIDTMQEQLAPQKFFLLPGPPAAAAHCHVARTVCRRAERAVVALGSEAIDPKVLIYLNRLSDFLFVFSRYISLKTNTPETYWNPAG